MHEQGERSERMVKTVVENSRAGFETQDYQKQMLEFRKRDARKDITSLTKEQRERFEFTGSTPLKAVQEVEKFEQVMEDNKVLSFSEWVSYARTGIQKGSKAEIWWKSFTTDHPGKGLLRVAQETEHENDWSIFYRTWRFEFLRLAGVRPEVSSEAARKEWKDVHIENKKSHSVKELTDFLDRCMKARTMMLLAGVWQPERADHTADMLRELKEKLPKGSDFYMF